MKIPLISDALALVKRPTTPDERQRRTIHIYPCVQSLLYAPLYLALQSFWFKNSERQHEHVTCTKSNIGLQWNIADEQLTIILYNPPAQGGDINNYERLRSIVNTPNEIHVAVGDPVTALAMRSHSGMDSNVIGTFVNRIALWGVCNRQNQNLIKRHVIGRMKKMADEGCTPLYISPGAFSSLVLGYSTAGETTKSIVETFLVRGFTTSDLNVTMGAGEIRGLYGLSEHPTPYDITFSFAPWLLKAFLDKESEEEFFILPWFRAVPYSFSGMVMFGTRDHIDSSAQLIDELLFHMGVGLTLLQRHKQEALRCLKLMASTMKYYGFIRELGDLSPNDCDRVLEEAFKHLIHADCFCDSMENAWSAWDLAFKANRDKFESLTSDPDKMIRDVFGRIRECKKTGAMWQSDAPGTRDNDKFGVQAVIDNMVRELKPIDLQRS